MTTTAARCASRDERSLVGAYLTDGRELYCVLDRLPETNLWQVEDCRTLDVLFAPSQRCEGRVR